MDDQRKIGERFPKESSYDVELDRAKMARETQRRDTDPRIEKEGFLGVDDIDRIRRRKLNRIMK